MFKSSVLFLALLLSSPALFSSFAGGMSLTAALTRFLICVPAAAIMIAALRSVTENYGKATRLERVQARIAAEQAQRAKA